MPTCREVSEACASEKPLRLKDKLHLFICPACTNFMKQLQVMKVAMKARAEKILKEEESEVRALEEKVIEQIKKATKS